MPLTLLYLLFGAMLSTTGLAQDCDPAPGIAYLGENAASKSDAAWLTRHQRQKNQVRTQNARILIVGDSIAAGWPSHLLRNSLGGSIVNLGIPGDRTQNALWRINDLGIIEQQPEYVLIVIGTNNVSDREGPCTVARGVFAVVGALRDMAPTAKIIVIGVPPRGSSFSFRSAEIAQINSLLRGLQSDAVFFLEPGLLVVGDRALTRFRDDMLHLSYEGYAELTQMLTELVHR